MSWAIGSPSINPETADVIVFKEGEHAVAVKTQTRQIIARSTDHAEVIQKAVNTIPENGVVVIIGTFQNVHVNITKPVLLRIHGTLHGNGSEPVIYVKTSPTLGLYPIIENGVIDGNGADGIVIDDSYHVVLHDIFISNARYGIHPRLVNYWTESLVVDKVVINNCERGIFFENAGSSYKSFGQARVDVDIKGCNYGIYLDANASLYRSQIFAVIWIPDNGVGVYNDGESAFAKWYLILESDYDTAKGIALGSNYAGDMVAWTRFYGNLTPVENPDNKKIVMYSAENEVRIPSGTFGEAIKIRLIDGTDVFAINKNTANDPVIGVFGKTLSVWDYTNGRNGDVKVGRLIASEAIITRVDVDDYGGNFANYSPSPSVEGTIILAIDTNETNPGKRLYVYANGAWHYVNLA